MSEVKISECYPWTFRHAYREARSASGLIESMTTPTGELPPSRVKWYLTDDGLAGYGITWKGEFIALFSRVRGRGDALVASAVENGAMYGDHFDSEHLSALYARHGFVETSRTPNWTSGGPDVIYIHRHADYPHFPGMLYDCIPCENVCYCENGSEGDCVSCAIHASQHYIMTID